MKILSITLLLVSASQAFLFDLLKPPATDCCAPKCQPACAPPAPPPPPPCAPSCGGGCGGCSAPSPIGYASPPVGYVPQGPPPPPPLPQGPPPQGPPQLGPVYGTAPAPAPAPAYVPAPAPAPAPAQYQAPAPATSSGNEASGTIEGPIEFVAEVDAQGNIVNDKHSSSGYSSGPVDDTGSATTYNTAANTNSATDNFEAAQTATNTEQEAVYDDIANNSEKGDDYHAIAQSVVRAKRLKVIRRAPTNKADFDPKCNSEVLKKIILENIHESTSTSKRKIQKAASEELGGRVDVVCSSGTFSYIVNTELYCETEKNGTTCFAFQQSN